MPEESQYKFFPLHKHRNLISECVELLNSTWPVSPTYRYVSLLFVLKLLINCVEAF